MKDALLTQLLADRAAKRPVVVVTRLPEGDQRLAYPGGDDPMAAAVDAAIRADKSGTVEVDGVEWFLNVFNPPLRMIIVGAVHIAQALAPAARAAGYDVAIIDPRTAFATDDRFPGATVSHDWPDEAMTALAPDTHTAVVTLTHDPKLDDPALHVSLRSPAFYIGALGSTRTAAKRNERLMAAGFTADDIARIHAPVGLAIGAKSPAEIAISIVAQVTSVLRGGRVR